MTVADLAESGDHTVNAFGEWVILELFGHRKAAGYATTAEFPAGFLRLDIPATTGPYPTMRPAATAWYSPSAIYAMHAVDEATARATAAAFTPRPVHRWELPAPPPAAVTDGEPDRQQDDDGHRRDGCGCWHDDD